MTSKSKWGPIMKNVAAEFALNVVKTACSKNYRDEQRRVLISAGARTLLTKFGATNEELVALEKSIASHGKEKSDQATCSICYDKPKSIVFLPCRHLATCPDCSTHIDICCICRGTIEERVNVFT